MRVNKAKLPEYLISLFLLIFGTTATFIRFILPSNILLQGIPVLAVALSVMMCLKLGSIRKDSVLVLAMIIVYLNRNQYLQDLNPRMILPFFVVCIMNIYSYKSVDWAKAFVTVAKWIYLFYGLCTIVFYFTPSFYKNTIVNLFPSETARLIRVYNSRSMPGLTEHYSTNAMFLAVGLSIVIASYFTNKRKSDLFSLALMVVALLLTGKRGHIIFIATAFFAVYYMVTAEKKNRFIKLLGMILVVLCTGVVLMNVFPVLSQFLIRFKETAKSGDITLSRVNFWNRAIQLFKENPLFGIGWNNFMLVQKSYGYTAHAHNVYIQLLAETGIVGTVIYLWWMVRSLTKTAKSVKHSIINNIDYDLTSRFLLYFSFGFQVFFLLYCLTGNPLYDEEMYIPYFICTAFGLFYYRKTREEGCR